MIIILFILISSFNTERITFNDQTDWIPTIAVDQSCKVHIAYTYPGQIRYITDISGSWVIDSILVSGSTPSIAATRGGSPHIVYVANDGNDDEIYYATFAGASWDIDTITDNSSNSKAPSIALAPDSTPHVVYYDFSGGLKIWHAVKISGVWSNEVIPASAIGTYSSIAVDSAGKAHAAFVTGAYGGNREIIYANDTSGSWVIESVTSDALDDDFPSIAVDKNKNVHIVYSKDDGSDWELWYATNSSGSFVATQLTNNVGINDYGYPSIAVDKNCYAHIAYQENHVAGNLFYFTNRTGSWERDTIFIGSWNKSYSWVDRNISMDNLGYIHVCFANQVNSASTSREIYHAVSDDAVGVEILDFSSSFKNFILCQNIPNPFRKKTNIKFQIPFRAETRCETSTKSQITLQIYNSIGQLVKSFNQLTNHQSSVNHIFWDGKNNNGQDVSSGVYIYVLQVGEQQQAKKMLLLK